MSSSDEPYWLGRASDEQKRLLKQHQVWTKSIGYLVHPTIATSLPKNAVIADIGTGTGIWPIDLSRSAPSDTNYTIHGYDISDEQFLPASSLPANVSLHLGDFKDPIPEELKGKYDLVNIRLVIISMGEGVWESTLRNVLQLLKPPPPPSPHSASGPAADATPAAIQWTEGNFFVARGFRGAEPSSTSGSFLTQAQLQLNNTLVRRFRYNFPDFELLFRDAGLGDVTVDVSSTDRLVEQRREFTEIGLGAVFAGLGNLARVREEGGKEGAEGNGEGYWSTEECERMREAAEGDMRSGAYLRWDLSVAVGWVGNHGVEG